jgi:signal transduction histidine kinase
VNDDGTRLVLPQLHLDDLLEELQHRITDVRSTRDRTRSLLEAVLAVGSDLDLQEVLRRIAEAASALGDAQYAALGVIAEGGGLSQFIAVGIDEPGRARIGELPRGHGVLGLLIREPHPLRLDDLGKDPSAYGFPPGHPPMTTFLGVPIRVRGEVFGNLYLTEKRGGGAFDEEDEAVVLALAAAAGVAIENARHYDVARRRERWLQASGEISQALLSGSDPEDVLQLVATRALELSGAATSFIALPHGADRLLVEVAAGQDADHVQGVALSIADSPCGQVLTSGQPARMVGEAAGGVLAREVAGSAVITPMADRGVLVVTTPAGAPPLQRTEVAELSAFAAQASLALEVAERRRDAERLVVFEDRDRIARDLHDLVIQRLFATGMALESAGRLIERPEAAQRVRHAVDDLDTTIREIRSTIYALQNEPSAAAGSLRSRLFEVIDAGAEQLGYAPSVRLTGLIDTSVPADLADHLLAVLRETLSNAARHAGATSVDVLLEVDESVRLEVRDDGRGLSDEGRRSGLANLAERARAVAGTFAAAPLPDGGPQVTFPAPLEG